MENSKNIQKNMKTLFNNKKPKKMLKRQAKIKGAPISENVGI
jgi:hypothetical protein